MIVCLASAISGTVLADTIILKNGRKITASHVVEQNGQVSYETPAGRLSFPVSIVDRVIHVDSSPASTAGTLADRAANLPIAPPTTIATAAGDSEIAAVRDGSIDDDLLSKLVYEATENPTPTAVARVVAAEGAARSSKSAWAISNRPSITITSAFVSILTMSRCCSKPPTFICGEANTPPQWTSWNAPGASSRTPPKSPNSPAGRITG